MIVDSEGFGFSTNWSDYKTYAPWVNLAGTNDACSIMTGGPSGDNYLNYNTGSDGSACIRSFNTTSLTLYWGVRVNLNNAITVGSYPFIFSILDVSANAQVALSISITGGGLVQNPNAAQATIAAGTFPTSGWFYLEIGTFCDPTAGWITIRLNGVQISTITGISTQGILASLSSVSFGQSLFNSGDEVNPGVNLAHLYICDSATSTNNTFLGDCRVCTTIPISNSATAFTPTGLSSNYLNAALTPPKPTVDYNSSSTLAAQDTFGFAALPSNIASVFGINVKTLAQKASAGTRAIEPIVISNTNTVTGTPVSLSSTFVQSHNIFPVDPHTSNAWTIAGLNAATVGYKIST